MIARNFMQLEDQHPSAFSTIQSTYSTGKFAGGQTLLVVRFKGAIRPHEAGVKDAKFMLATVQAGITMFSPAAVLYDFRDFHCQGGGCLGELLVGDCRFLPRGCLPGPGCEAALRAYLQQEAFEKPEYFLFKNLEEGAEMLALRLADSPLEALLCKDSPHSSELEKLQELLDWFQQHPLADVRRWTPRILYLLQQYASRNDAPEV